MMLTTGWAVSAWLLLLLLLPPLPGPSATAAAAAEDVVEYKVGVLMTTKLDSPFDLERCGPAVDLALEMVNEKFLAHHRIRLKKVESSYPSCSGAHAPGLAAKMYFTDKVIAFIGPACAFALEPVARLAAFWNLPIITGMGDQPPTEVSAVSGILSKWKNDSGMFGSSGNNGEYPTLTKMSYCQCRLTQVFLSIFKKFNWSHVGLILDNSDLFSLTVGKNLESDLRKAGVLRLMREIDGNDPGDSCEKYLKDVSMYARVVILCVRGTLVRKCMLTAHRLQMTKGEWAFLDVELVQGSYLDDEHGWFVGDDEDTSARKAYQALLRVSLLKPTSTHFHNFSDMVKQRALEYYNYTLSENEEVNFFVGAFYDGVHLLGMALNETLTNKQNIKDGKAITSLMWNRTFNGVTGRVRIDANGARDADYAILDLDPITGRFEMVARYYGEARNYSPVVGKHIHWPGGSDGPPNDIPSCGFLGNECDSKDAYYITLYALIAFTVFISFVTVLAFIVNRQLKLAADLNNMSWRVRPEEVLIEVSKPYSSRLALQKPTEIFEPALQEKLICRRRSDTSNSSLPPAQVYTTVGIYKGSRVAIKKVVKKKVDLNKKLLWEIKQVRDVTHENTVRFIGACIHCPTVLILTEYCPKGSLKDVLENDALRLDWNFRMSLIHDIVKGMAFLHSCEVGVHGKLRSSNCLIDGRFVLKLSNFGLRTLTTPSEVVHDSVYYHKLLWVAPELLSEHSSTNLIPATQKGDVYSFAIVLEEIVVRGGPYEFVKNDLTTQEILERVEKREEPYFRPDISGHDCPEPLSELMQRCWNDVPEERPGFDIMRSIVRQMTRGYCENLMDDLVLRMEQYANNLEALVEEKTDQLSQEKRRSEELLFQVLPRPVAQQLMAGEMVKPEQFENVTVYFSDIVGFTVLCAQSSPMQVVNLLNDLYSTFDRIIGFYDVYKVETIGDAYMVVSGLPERNGDNHAKEIALMALAILDAVQMFTIQHKPDAQLKVRIGIHTGPVCAGVVGQKMPHYCLFGDTVNTASRMESTGEPLRIHVSWATKYILDTFRTFKLELRGDVELKGKGAVVTYWLVGCTEQDPRPPTPISTDTLDPNNPYPLIFPELSK